MTVPDDTPPTERVSRLSERELSVLRGIADDKTYAQIGNDLGIGHESIKSYANRLRAKLGVDSKVGLALFWERYVREKETA